MQRVNQCERTLGPHFGLLRSRTFLLEQQTPVDQDFLRFLSWAEQIDLDNQTGFGADAWNALFENQPPWGIFMAANTQSQTGS